MSIVRFAVFTFAGSLVWSIALTLVGYYLGEAWVTVSEDLSLAFTAIGAVIVAGAIAGIVVWYVRRKKRSARPPS
jgi:membrane protein DedA with SNARE-associated domain